MNNNGTSIPSAFQLAAEVKQRARAVGFDLVGIASASPSAYRDYLSAWLETQQHGSMEYLARRFDERSDPGRYLPGARSIICVAINYHVPLEPVSEADRPHRGRVSRYALGTDYHELIKDKLFELADWMRSVAPESHTKVAVDTAPVMEKELAARTGVGWQGKHTCIINTSVGSWLLLGEILTTQDLPPDAPAVDRCGSCTRCIDACPTQAITAPYQLDARKCISYLTIEHKGEIDPALQPMIGDWLYGCDICQEVCPWNRDALVATASELQPRFATGSLDVREVLQWGVEEYRVNLRGSAMKRVKLPVLQRNAAIVATNASVKA